MNEIIPIAKSPLVKFLENKPFMRPAADKPSTLYDIIDFPINIIVKENTSDEKFLTSQDVGKEVIFAPENSENPHQRFTIGVMPLTGYIIIKNTEGKLVSAGQYNNQPGVDILYIKSDEKLFAASWKFIPGQVTQSSYIIENTDVIASDGEPTIGNVYWKCIGSKGSKVYFDKYKRLAKQEFEIRVIDDFELQSIEYINDVTATLKQIPDFKVNWIYTNDSDVQQSVTTNFGKKAIKTSNFTNKTTISFKASTEIKANVPFIASGKISTEVSRGKEFSYGTSQTKEDTREYNIPILVPARTKIEATATVTQYEMNVGYIATLVGKKTGKIMKVAGTWNGVDVTDINISVKQTNLVSGTTRTVHEKKIL